MAPFNNSVATKAERLTFWSLWVSCLSGSHRTQCAPFGPFSGPKWRQSLIDVWSTRSLLPFVFCFWVSPTKVDYRRRKNRWYWRPSSIPSTGGPSRWASLQGSKRLRGSVARLRFLEEIESSASCGLDQAMSGMWRLGVWAKVPRSLNPHGVFGLFGDL